MRYVTISALVLVLAAGLIGCGGSKGVAGKAGYGKAIPADMAITPAREIMASPKDFEGKDVLVKGKITSECPSGGWIWLQDGSEQIYVNMHPTNVFIPQKVGSTVRAIGKVVLEQGRPQVVGYGLEFP